MKPEWFSSEDLCKIIAGLEDSGVRVLKYRGLEIDCTPAQMFHVEHSSDGKSWTQDPEPGSSMHSQEPAKTVPLTTPEEDWEAHVELLKIEDPEEYEKLLLEGKINGDAETI